MALVKLEKINDNSSWAMWKIEEPLSALAEYVQWDLSELDEWQQIHHPKKQAEWLAGRVALKAVLLSWGVASFNLFKDDKGKPHLTNSDWHISLANAYPYGVAVMHRHCPVGIDIERPSEKLWRIRHKFLNAKELIAAQDDLANLCVYWCIKECLYKLYGRKQLSLKQHIAVEKLAIGGIINSEASIQLEAERSAYQLAGTRVGEFYVVYSVLP